MYLACISTVTFNVCDYRSWVFICYFIVNTLNKIHSIPIDLNLQHIEPIRWNDDQIEFLFNCTFLDSKPGLIFSIYRSCFFFKDIIMINNWLFGRDSSQRIWVFLFKFYRKSQFRALNCMVVFLLDSTFQTVFLIPVCNRSLKYIWSE